MTLESVPHPLAPQLFLYGSFPILCVPFVKIDQCLAITSASLLRSCWGAKNVVQVLLVSALRRTPVILVD